VTHADALFAPSEYTAKRHRNARLKPPIHVLPLYSAIEPKSMVSPPQRPRPRFLYVGRLIEPKGIGPLLDEFARLPAYDLHVIGAGDLRRKLEQRFIGCRHIRFLGELARTELVAAYRDATALIFPSLAPETFGLSIVEAFACGTPAIVRDAGGCREPIDATGGGLVYRTDEELRVALARIVNEPGLRERLALRARDGFLRLYTPKRHVESYLAHIAAIRAAKGLH
jgi:glycosyltransferase involved in cell wall biosynthesis